MSTFTLALSPKHDLLIGGLMHKYGLRSYADAVKKALEIASETHHSRDDLDRMCWEMPDRM